MSLAEENRNIGNISLKISKKMKKCQYEEKRLKM